jgi:hypothetical protein
LKEILSTTDRSLALKVGRALEAQRFFHDVNYENRLIDDIIEIYQFNQVLFHNNRSGSTTSTTSSNSSSNNSFSVTSTIIGNYASEDEEENDDDDSNSLHTDTTAATTSTTAHLPIQRQPSQLQPQLQPQSQQNQIDKLLPNGIYTNLTHCYTPTCDNINPCYSYTCPKRERLVKINLNIIYVYNA